MARTVEDIFIKDLRLCAGKRVLVRLDWNVAVNEKGAVLETERINRTFPLLEQLALMGSTIIVVSHRGEESDTLLPIATYVQDKLPFVHFIQEKTIDGVKTSLATAEKGNIYILENIRSFEGELTGSKYFGESLASLAEIYINDAFSVSHRKHASITETPKHILSYAGPLFENEIKHLTSLVRPELPALFILGGAKIRTKFSLIETYLDRGAYVFVGGAMVHNIFKQIGVEIGASRYDPTFHVPQAIIDNPRLLIPVDVITSDGESHTTDDIKANEKIVDCGKLTVALLTKHIAQAKTIIVNGPVGLYEEGWKFGTEMIISHVSEAKNAKRVLGGGDTLTVLEHMNAKLNFTFVSLAGGAMLDYLTQGTLPGIETLMQDVTL